MKKHLGIVIGIVVALVVGLLPTSVPVRAQSLPPSVAVTPVWNVATQLTTVDTIGSVYPNWDTGDDYRYVDARIFATTTLEFWTVQMTCTVTPTVLTSYNAPTPGGDPGDDVEPIIPGPDWQTWDDDPNPVLIKDNYNTTTGARTFTISRKGVHNNSVGRNGEQTTILIATLRYQVKSQAANPFSGAANLACTSTFLNRNGQPVVPTVTYTAPPALQVRSGYSIQGTVRYQDRTVHTGIGVICDPDFANDFTLSTRTTTTGSFTINNVRRFGGYDCYFFGQNVTNEVAPASVVYNPDAYLPEWTYIYLSSNGANSMTLLPVTLFSGNSTRGPVTGGNMWDENIDSTDISDVTSNYNRAPYGLTVNYGAGDVNNDKKVDKVDLALVTGNYGYGGILPAEHVILSAQRVNSPTNIYPDHRIWVNVNPTDQGSGRISQMVPGTNNDYWPAISPDGSKLVVSRAVVTNGVTQYALYVMNSDGTGTATRLTPGATGWPNQWQNMTYDAFAPSWSPDGTQIAFVCSSMSLDPNPQNRWRQMYSNMGALCVMSANGRNLRQVIWGTKIYPPAWVTADTLVFGSTMGGNCPNTLCLVTTEGSNTFADTVDNDIPPSNDPNAFADMPTIVRGNILIYRYQTALNDTTLRVASIDPADFPGPGGPTPDRVEPFTLAYTGTLSNFDGAAYHTAVQFDGNPDPGIEDYGLVSSQVDYYTLGGINDLRLYYYEYQYDAMGQWYNSNTGQIIKGDMITDLGLNPVPLWENAAENPNFYPDSIWGNPGWDGNPDHGTDLWALRVTLDWVP